MGLAELSDDARLGAYVPSLVLEWQRVNPGATHRTVVGSLAFFDLSGFTALSERLARRGRVGAEEIAGVLNTTFSELLVVARNEGGDLLKFGGDALTVLFCGSDHALRASRAAMLMRQALRSTGRLDTAAGVVRLRMSVGIATGDVELFLVGDSHRELILTGPTVDAALALERAAAAGEIAVAESTAKELETRSLGAARAGGRLLARVPRRIGAPLAASSFAGPDARDLDVLVPVGIRDHLRSSARDDQEHRHATVAFVRFSNVNELRTRDPALAATALHSLVSDVQTAAAESGVTFLGTDIATDGGKVILVAGAPETHDNDEERMLRAARSIVERDPQLSVCIGVARGPVFVLDIGPGYRRTYTLIGDTVNLAARLAERAAPRAVLAAVEVVNRSSVVFETSALDAFVPKGKSVLVEPVFVGKPLGPRMSTAAELPFVGRQAQRGVLHELVRTTVRGRGRVATLVGDAGVGKSRLAHEVRHTSPWPSVAIACEEYQISTPFAASAKLLRALLSIGGDASADKAGEQLAERVDELAPSLRPWLPLLAVATRATVPATEAVDQLSPQFRVARMHEATAELLHAATRTQLMLVVEDIHWIDDASDDLLLHVAEHVVPDAGWLLLATQRPDGRELKLPASAYASRVDLPPLDSQERVDLAMVAAEGGHLRAAEIIELAARSGGNPLFIRELVASAHNVDEDDLPPTVEGIIATRIDRLERGDRSLLRRAAVLGTTIDPAVLAAVLGSDAVRVTDPRTWDALFDFVEPHSDGSVRFRHALFRDVAYTSLPFRLRRQLHQRAAEFIERQHQVAPDDVAELLAFHFFRGHVYERAWEYSQVAGRRAQSAYANTEAIALFRQAIEAHRRTDAPADETADVWEALGDAEHVAGLMDDAVRSFRKARQFAAPGALPRLMRKEGAVRERMGKYSAALRWYTRGLEVFDLALPTAGTSDQTALVLAAASARMRQGRRRDAKRLCDVAVEQATSTDDRANLALAYFLLGWAHTDDDRHLSSHFRALSLEIYEELQDLRGQANVLVNLGIGAYFEGRWDDAMDYYERARSAHEQAGDVVNAAVALNNIGEVLSDQGRIEDAERLFRTARQLWVSAKYEIGVAVAESNLGYAATRAGRLAEGRVLLDGALDRFRAVRADEFALETQARGAENLLRSGAYRDSQDLAVRVLEQAQRLGGTLSLVSRLHRCIGLSRIAEGEVEDAAAQFELSLQSAEAAGSDFERACTLTEQSALLTASGDPAGRELRKTAERLFEKLGCTVRLS